jgi:hypothetical protein
MRVMRAGNWDTGRERGAGSHHLPDRVRLQTGKDACNRPPAVPCPGMLDCEEDGPKRPAQSAREKKRHQVWGAGLHGTLGDDLRQTVSN